MSKFVFNIIVFQSCPVEIHIIIARTCVKLLPAGDGHDCKEDTRIIIIHTWCSSLPLQKKKEKKENQTEKNRMTFSGLVFEMSAYRPTEINLFDDDNIIIIVESCSNGFTRFSNIIVHLPTYSGAQTTEKCPRENRGQKSVKSETLFTRTF